MFQEYRLEKGNDYLVLRRIATAFLPHLLALVAAATILNLTRPINIRGTIHVNYVLIIFIFSLIISMVSQYFSAKRFRMISSDRSLSWSSRGTNVTVEYSDMVRIEKDEKGSLYIYTQSSDSTPVIILTRLMTNIDQLEQFLSGFIPVSTMQKMPFMLRPDVRAVFSFVYMICIFLNIMSASLPIMYVTLLTFIVAISISMSFTLRFRKEVSMWKSVTIQLVMLAAMLLKTAVFTLTYIR